MMKVNQAYRYELDPNRQQRLDLYRYAGLACFAYNWGLENRVARFELMEGKEKFTTAYTQAGEWTAMRNDFAPWSKEVSRTVPDKALMDLEKAFKNFWRGLKNKKKVGFPRFKKQGVHDSFHLNNERIRIESRRIRFERLGWIKTKEETDLKGTIRVVTILREVNHWFVSFTVERERPNPKPVEGSVVGIDMGLTAFATLSNGMKIEAPKPLRQYLQKKRRLSKSFSRKKKGSQNRKKAIMKAASLDYKIKNQRRDFLHKITTKLAKTHSVIVLEDLSVQNMMKNHHLARHIADVGWGEFRRMLEYKVKWYGSTVHMANKFFPSSKTCSRCGVIKENLELKDRQFVCDACGFSIDRDLNAAINLRNLVAVNRTETQNACGEESAGSSLGKSETILNETGTVNVGAS